MYADGEKQGAEAAETRPQEAENIDKNKVKVEQAEPAKQENS